MESVQEPARPEVGHFNFEVYGSGRGGRRRVSHFKLRCDAVGLHGAEILLLSVVGPETGVKALTAGLRASGKDQQRIEYSAHVADVNAAHLARCPEGYRIYRTKLDYGLWHVLCLARREGFVPVLNDETVWRLLRRDPFTTPLLRQWAPWLHRAMMDRGAVVELTQSGCQAGLLLADNDALDALVSEGLQGGHLAVNGQTADPCRPEQPVHDESRNLDDFLRAYGPMLGKQAERSLQPLHVPGRDPTPPLNLLRDPFEAQSHLIEAVRKALRRQKAILLVGEMGTGKMQPNSCKVLTPAGWVAIGQIKVGDTVINPDGGVTRVVGVYPQGELEVHRVTFTDGSSTLCGLEHLWLVNTPLRKFRKKTGRVLTLKQILELGLSHGNGNLQHFVPMVRPVEFPEAELRVNPYLLGYLIGDGCLSNEHAVYVSVAESEGVARIRRILEGLTPTGVTLKHAGRCDYRITADRGQGNPLLQALKSLGLMGCRAESKFIPEPYLLGSVRQREMLLQGLMDSDGCIANDYGTGVEFVTTSARLARGVAALVQSLGGTATVSQKIPRYRYRGEQRKGQLAYRLYIALPNSIRPFLLTRKSLRHQQRTKYQPTRAVCKVEPAGRAECTCIGLEPGNQLYVTDDYIVTHNTLMGMAAIHAHAGGRPYRALVFCPGQLVRKWEREIRETIPGAGVVQVETWQRLLRLNRAVKPACVEWYVIGRDRAKLGAKWRPAYQRRTQCDDGFLRCPQCGRRLVDDNREPLRIGHAGTNGQPGLGLWKRRAHCEWVLADRPDDQGTEVEQADSLVRGCGSPLWQMTGEIRRYEPALFIKRRLRNFFRYLILDEVHEEKGADTAQGHAAAALAASCRKVVALTGTLIGGYAEHLRPLLFRLSPGSLIREGLGWSDATAFNECYGRIETRITERSGGTSGEGNRMSRGSKTTTKSMRPGVMPALFARHLIDKAVFLGLGEVAGNLPPLEEECIPVRMDPELAAAYRQEVEAPLAAAVKEMMKRRDRRLLGTMLQTLLAYPDHPLGWGPVGYRDAGRWVTVATPPDLAEEAIRPKEQALLDLVRSEAARRRKVWVYVQYTDRHDVQGRLETLLARAGLRVAVLRSSVPLACREEWIAGHAPGIDVVVSHPRLVETGLDLFDKAGRHNFPTLCFYETGYNLFTLRQASRRSWRIGQTQTCRIVYFHYEGTMQERAMALMGKKLTAAQALEGTFSSEGLVAMAGEDANVEMALARSLADRMDEGDVRRLWNRAFHPGEHPEGPLASGDCVEPPASCSTIRPLWPDIIGRAPDASPFRQRRPPTTVVRRAVEHSRRRNPVDQRQLF